MAGASERRRFLEQNLKKQNEGKWRETIEATRNVGRGG
jgi:hypothetical protein